MAAPTHDVRVQDSSAALAAALGAYIQGVDASATPGSSILVALSGGSLPKSLAAALSHLHETGVTLSWARWHIFYVDERVVPLDDAESNHGACVKAIFSQAWCSIPPSNIHPINPSLSPAACAAAYEADVKAAWASDSMPVFDLILLGMGPDGHTASLFPGHSLLLERGKLVDSIADSPKPPPQRVTFTYPLINHAKHVAFVATGEGKADALKSILNPAVPLDESLPSARIRQQDTMPPTWFIDAPLARAVGLSS